MRAAYCRNCGLEPGDRFRCRACQTLDPDAALVASNVALLLIFLAVNFFYLFKVIPNLASQYAGQGLQLPWLTRMYVFAVNLTLGPGGMAAIVVLVPLLIWRRSVVVDWLKDPRLSGGIAWLVVAVTLFALSVQWSESGF